MTIFILKFFKFFKFSNQKIHAYSLEIVIKQIRSLIKIKKLNSPAQKVFSEVLPTKVQFKRNWRFQSFSL